MVNDDVLTRLSQWRRMDRSQLVEMVDIRLEDDRLIFMSGERYLRAAKSNVLTVAATVACAAVICGLMAPQYGYLFGFLACLPAIFGSSFVRRRRLLEMDAHTGSITVCQATADAGIMLTHGQISEIEGRYETKGWDLRSVIVAQCLYVRQVNLIVLPGSDKELAVYLCKLLGYLLDRSASYAGAEGRATICYEPLPVS